MSITKTEVIHRVNNDLSYRVQSFKKMEKGITSITKTTSNCVNNVGR